jgi:hypothetical protein
MQAATAPQASWAAARVIPAAASKIAATAAFLIGLPKVPYLSSIYEAVGPAPIAGMRSMLATTSDRREKDNSPARRIT